MTSQDAAQDAALVHSVSTAFQLDKPRRIGVAVSGGSDSMALLSLLHLWTEAEGIEFSAVTVDHGLRPEARDEAQMVAKHCAKLGISHNICAWTGWDGAGNMQAQARDARYKLIADWALETGVDTVALGHTRDDQAENFLIRLARQSGVDGLATMSERFKRYGVGWVRPMLRLARAELRDHLTRRGVAWVDDPSNDDDAFDRVRARKVLRELAPLGITGETLASVGKHMSDARFALERFTQVEADRIVTSDRGDVLVSFSSRPSVASEIQRRILIKALKWIGRGRYGPRETALGDMDIAFMQGAACHTLAGCVITNKDNDLRICREYNAVRDLTCATDKVWDGRWRFDGPHDPVLRIAALGEGGLKQRPDWRDCGLPRMSLLASPAIWRGDDLQAAPLLGTDSWDAGWTAHEIGSFHAFLAQN